MKKALRRLANIFGYDFIKTDRHTPKQAKYQKTVSIGKFSLIMPGNNPLLSGYKYVPELNFELGRLSKIIEAKYSSIVIFDVGANVGDTIAVIRNFTDAQVVGVEGDSVSYSFLKKNIAQFDNVTVLDKYLGEKKDTINVDLDKSGWNTTLIPSETQSTKVELDTIDNVVESMNFGNKIVKLLKVDTEGFDPIIIRGAKETLSRHKPAIFFEYNKENMEAIGEAGLDLFKFVSKYGYKKVLFFDHMGRFMLATETNDDQLLSYLHNYAIGTNSSIAYYDLCIFHSDDDDIATSFIKSESAQ